VHAERLLSLSPHDWCIPAAGQIHPGGPRIFLDAAATRICRRARGNTLTAAACGNSGRSSYSVLAVQALQRGGRRSMQPRLRTLIVGPIRMVVSGGLRE
jgi:hypothetical protein